MLNYHLIQRPDPRDRSKPAKWYATSTSAGRTNIDDISADISGSSSLSRGDIMNVLMSLVDQVPKYLLDGKSVVIGELGTIRIGFSSEGVSEKETFHASQIDHAKIIFTPGKKLKQILRNVHYKATDQE